jgi:diacylglycerol kinase family enzyme
MGMSWLAILNPAAHNRRYRTHVRWLARELHRRLGAECILTAYPGHAREIAGAGRGYDGCIVVGGDGTLFEIVNGLDLRRQCLGLVPVGTGNGFARDLGLRGSAAALQALARPHPTPVDLIRARYRVNCDWREQWVVSTSSVGYVAEVVALALGPLKRLAHFRYAVAAYLQRSRKRLKEYPARLRVDDGPWQEGILTNLAVNNTRHAGHFCLFPEARIRDGRLNLLYGRVGHLSQLVEDIAILTRTYFFGRSLRRLAQLVEVELEKPATLMLDGELVHGVDAVRFEVVPGALRCCTPAPR